MTKFEIFLPKTLPQDKDIWKDRYVFKSHNNQYELVFSNPFEISMGAYSWDIGLFENKRDISSEHPVIKSINLELSGELQPWSSSSAWLLCNKDTATIYNLATNSLQNIGFSVPRHLSWSYSRDELLSVFSDSGYIFDTTNKLKNTFKWAIPRGIIKSLWIKDSEQFILLSQSPHNSLKTQVALYDAITSKEVDTFEFDAQSVFPLDSKKHEFDPDHSDCLLCDNGLIASSSLLYEWADVLVDSNNTCFLLSILRPYGELMDVSGLNNPLIGIKGKICRAEKKWIGLRIL